MANLSDRATGLTNVNQISLNELSVKPADPASGQKKLYAKNDGKVYTLDSEGNEKEVGSGGGASVEVVQADHGFAVGDVLYFDGSSYAKAKADAENTAEVVGIVSEVVDTGNFVATTAGYIEEGLSGLTAGSVYYLSADDPGALSLVEPLVVGQVSRPVLLATAADKGFVLPYRGIVVGGSNARTSLSLNNNGSTDIQDMGGYEAGELSGWVSIVNSTPASSLRFYVEAQVSQNGAEDDYNISYQTSGDTPPSGFDMAVSSDGMVSVVLPDVSGFDSAKINYSLNAAAIGVDLPLSISGENILEATSSVRGTVKKNRWQKKVVPEQVTTNTTFMTFNNLVIGKTYQLSYVFTLRVDNVDGLNLFEIVHNSVMLSSPQLLAKVTAGSIFSSSGDVRFTAEASTVSFVTTSASDESRIYDDRQNFPSYVIITELNNFEAETSDFT